MEGIQNFLQIIGGMQWSDYLDIIVVAFLIYKLLPLLKTPNVMRIARTVIALVIIAWLTDVMKLHTLSWILNQFLAIGLLAFVVLFQPELRRMLDHLGNVQVLRRLQAGPGDGRGDCPGRHGLRNHEQGKGGGPDRVCPGAAAG